MRDTLTRRAAHMSENGRLTPAGVRQLERVARSNRRYQSARRVNRPVRPSIKVYSHLKHAA